MRNRLNRLIKHDLHGECSASCQSCKDRVAREDAQAKIRKAEKADAEFKSLHHIPDDPIVFHDDKGNEVDPVKYMLMLWQHNQILASELIGIFLAHNIMNWFEKINGEVIKNDLENVSSARTVVRRFAEVDTEVFFTKAYLDGTAPVNLFSDDLMDVLHELDHNDSLIAGTFRIVPDFTAHSNAVTLKAVWLEFTTEVSDAGNN